MNDRALRVLEYNKILDRLAARTVSEQGRLAALALRPSGELAEVLDSQARTAEAVEYNKRLGSDVMQAFPDVSHTLAKARIGSVLTMKELLDFGRFLAAVRSVKRRLARPEDDPIGDGLLDAVSVGLTDNRLLEEEIARCILGEEEMSDDASPLLRSLRVKQRTLADRVREKLNNFIRSPQYQKYIQEPIVTVRSDRYVIPVKAECRQYIPGLIHDQSSTGATLFIEPMSVVEINNDAKRLRAEENAEIERILAQLTADVGLKAGEYAADNSILVELDVIFAKAKLATEMKATAPVIDTERYIELRQARHPLLNPATVVPIDLHMGREFTSLIITGPNTGGKTVTLKTVGLFELMALSGMQIPAAEGSRIAMFSEVYADIGDEQSVEQSLSTFSSHMIHIAEIVRRADIDSLVLFDELCSGTDPAEGAALAMAVLDHLRTHAIRSVVNTHYSELKAYSLAAEGVENASVEFDVETLRPTYRLSIGIPGKSNAFEISRHLGLPEEIITEAGRHLSQKTIRFEEVLTNAEYHKQLAEKERAVAEEMRRDIAMMQSRMAAKEREMAELSKKTEAKAKENAARILAQARTTADQLLAQMREDAKKVRDEAAMESARSARRQLEEAAAAVAPTLERSDDTLHRLKEFRVGESAYLSTVGKNCVIASPPNKKGDISVTIDNLSLKANTANLYEPLKEKKEKAKTGSVRRSIMAGKEFSLSLDLRGQNVDEACLAIDKYIDDAYLAGVHEISIIHGKGTGALRAGVQEYLRGLPRVKSFRLGAYGEGDAGVTVVELKNGGEK
ncbi:MAG: endonuclease MutS2 [Eubacteriales bacterium]|nr:endonuclease MutS2 [Eubacteriales bacterium]